VNRYKVWRLAGIWVASVQIQVPALQLCNYTKVQLQELSHHEMLVTMFPSLSVLANICLIILVSTASVERSFGLEIALGTAASTI